MSTPREWIDGYFDETLTAAEHAALEAWLAESPEHARQFARAARLHDALCSARRNAIEATDAVDDAESDSSSVPSRSLTETAPYDRRRLRAMLFAALATAAVLTLVLVWPGVADRAADASVAELRRVLTASRTAADRLYRITVEESAKPEPRRAETSPRNDGRPPKPPLDDAQLYVGRGGRWVLVRHTENGQPFTTGSDGTSSWAVRPDGPVRTSADPGRFQRDVPGHENSLPLVNLHEGFQRLTQAYEIHVLPVEPNDDRGGDSNDAAHGDTLATDSAVAAPPEPTRLLVAVKKRGERGPRRVEISYFERSGLIRELRFVDMPYGPDRLTLRMTLADESPLDDGFFRHESHHEAGRTVEIE